MAANPLLSPRRLRTQAGHQALSSQAQRQSFGSGPSPYQTGIEFQGAAGGTQPALQTRQRDRPTPVAMGDYGPTRPTSIRPGLMGDGPGNLGGGPGPTVQIQPPPESTLRGRTDADRPQTGYTTGGPRMSSQLARGGQATGGGMYWRTGGVPHGVISGATAGITPTHTPPQQGEGPQIGNRFLDDAQEAQRLADQARGSQGPQATNVLGQAGMLNEEAQAGMPVRDVEGGYITPVGEAATVIGEQRDPTPNPNAGAGGLAPALNAEGEHPGDIPGFTRDGDKYTSPDGREFWLMGYDWGDGSPVFVDADGNTYVGSPSTPGAASANPAAGSDTTSNPTQYQSWQDPQSGDVEGGWTTSRSRTFNHGPGQGYESPERLAADLGITVDELESMLRDGYEFIRASDGSPRWKGPGQDQWSPWNSETMADRVSTAVGDMNTVDDYDPFADMPDAPELDEAAMEEAIQSVRRRNAAEVGQAMRIAAAQAARGGMGAGYQSGLGAEASHRGGIASAEAEAQTRMQHEMANFQAQIAHYQNQVQNLRMMANFHNDEQVRAEAARRADSMLQKQLQMEKQLMLYQHDLNNRIGWKDVLGGLFSLGGSAAGAYFGRG